MQLEINLKAKRKNGKNRPKQEDETLKALIELIKKQSELDKKIHALLTMRIGE